MVVGAGVMDGAMDGPALTEGCADKEGPVVGIVEGSIDATLLGPLLAEGPNDGTPLNWTLGKPDGPADGSEVGAGDSVGAPDTEGTPDGAGLLDGSELVLGRLLGSAEGSAASAWHVVAPKDSQVPTHTPSSAQENPLSRNRS